MNNASLRRDWAQFRLLSKDGVRQLIDSALLSRDSDPMQFALWMLALVAVPPAFVAAREMLTYTALVNAPDAVVQRVALSHRLFFITYGMLAAALLASLIWEAVFPDGRDQEIVGVLPVRPYVFAASRLASALLVGAVFAAAVNVPAAAIYSLFSFGHPVFHLNLPGLLIGHVLATMLGSMLVFWTLLTLRGLAAIVFGVGAGKWLGAALQLVSVILMFEAFFFLPGVLGQAFSRVTRNDPALLNLPPVWFAGLHAWFVGSANQLLEAAMVRGLIATTASFVILVPTFLLPARWLGKRALDKRARERATALSLVVRVITAITFTTPPVRSVFLFAIASLVRSRRHLIVLASYAGMAVAVGIAAIEILQRDGPLQLDRPAWWMLSLPMLFVFFGVAGLRASFRIPTELDANWPWRLTQPSLATCVNGSVLVIFTVVAVPVAALTTLALAPTWPWRDLALAVALQTIAALAFIEWLLLRWTKVPFACAHSPSPEVFKAWWPIWIIGMYLYAFKLAQWQFAALSSTAALTAYVSVGVLTIAGIRLVRYRERRHTHVEFDAGEDGSVERLNLSEALN